MKRRPARRRLVPAAAAPFAFLISLDPSQAEGSGVRGQGSEIKGRRHLEPSRISKRRSNPNRANLRSTLRSGRLGLRPFLPLPHRPKKNWSIPWMTSRKRKSRSRQEAREGEGGTGTGGDETKRTSRSRMILR